MRTPTTNRQTIAEIGHKFHLALLYAFGSRGREVWEWATAGTPLPPAPDHDIDIGVKSLPDCKLTVREKVALAQALESLFKVPRVDVVCLEETDPFLAVNIIRGERLFAADAYTAAEYELYLLRRAGDLAPFERARMNAILEGRPL